MQYGIATGLPDIPMVDAPDLQRALQPVHSAVTKLAQATSDATGMTVRAQAELSGALDQQFALNRFNQLVLVANVAIPYGRLMGLANVSGKARWVLADSGTGIRPLAICLETGGIAAGKLGRGAMGMGLLKNVAGVTAATMYWVGSGGTFVSSRPAAVNFYDPVAVGLDSTTLAFMLSWKA